MVSYWWFLQFCTLSTATSSTSHHDSLRSCDFSPLIFEILKHTVSTAAILFVFHDVIITWQCKLPTHAIFIIIDNTLWTIIIYLWLKNILSHKHDRDVYIPREKFWIGGMTWRYNQMHISKTPYIFYLIFHYMRILRVFDPDLHYNVVLKLQFLHNSWNYL